MNAPSVARAASSAPSSRRRVADPVAELGRRLLGERDREDRRDVDAVLEHRAHEPLDEHRGLAAAGARVEQQIARAALDRIPLLRGESTFWQSRSPLRGPADPRVAAPVARARLRARRQLAGRSRAASATARSSASRSSSSSSSRFASVPVDEPHARPARPRDTRRAPADRRPPAAGTGPRPARARAARRTASMYSATCSRRSACQRAAGCSGRWQPLL